MRPLPLFRRAKREESSSFLKKRTKKLLFSRVHAGRSVVKRAKVFCFFFSKKKYFFHCFQAPVNRHRAGAMISVHQ
jgi:hypothetical protein